MPQLRALILPGLAVLGAAYAGWTAAQSRAPKPMAQAVSAPPMSPFPSFVAGAGLVEAACEHVAYASEVAGVIADVAVAPGAEVASGAVLFRLDDRAARAVLAQAEAQETVAAARLADLRERDARVQAGLAARADLISRDEAERSKAAVAIASAEAAAAAAATLQARTSLDLRTVRARAPGTVLKVHARPGQAAPTGITAEPLVLVGDLRALQVRVDIDEHDAWRVQPGARAVAVARGNASQRADLVFLRIEPYIVPKRSLTGESTERVDTRVLHVIFQLAGATTPFYAGSQVEVFIATEPAHSASAAVSASASAPAAATSAARTASAP